LRGALEIYEGKMGGLSGVPDLKELREIAMQDKMKDLLRQNIDACIKEF
jgi:hypothetical protein